ncbi:MAG: putative alcohol dehydrogenase [Frankiales bacterium]|nr:putative alcohol dehydrogenase [Frankiales bacterium]
MVGKRGRVVVTNLQKAAEHSVSMSLLDLTLYEKQVVGSVYGSANPRADIPRLLELWSQGQVDLDTMVTRTYSLEQVNDGFDDLRAGRNIRACSCTRRCSRAR